MAWVFYGAVILLIYPLLYKIYMPRVNAFGCFDDCFNFGAGYFLLKGKHLYAEIFFNHQPFMAVISALIQKITRPQNLYELVLRHRQMVLFYSFFFNILIVWRFRIAGLGFVLLYEFSKFYLFGDRFLGEALSVYPLVYLFGLAWMVLNRQKIYAIEFVLTALFCWFVIFTREPYVPVALILYFIILWKTKKRKLKFVSALILAILTFATLARLPLGDYFFNVVTVSRETVFAQEAKEVNFFGGGALKVFFYPFYILLQGKWNIFRAFLIGLTLIFLFLFVSAAFRKSRLNLVIIFLILGLANLRPYPPGQLYYGAFHMLIWYGLFLFILMLLTAEAVKTGPKTGRAAFILLILLLMGALASPQWFIRDKIDPHEEFMTNYGHYLQTGEVVKILSEPSDTLFLDGFDEIIYWQADRVSPYEYVWYTAYMPAFPKYSLARERMFRENPPDFYYGSCPSGTDARIMLAPEMKENYTRLLNDGKPSCLWVNKAKVPAISPARWQKAREFLYTRPEIKLPKML